MIHDHKRVDAIRTRATAQLAMITALEAKITKGKDELLEIARHQTEDIDTFFLQDLARHDRTPDQEAQWLSAAEHNLQTWVPHLRQIQEHFDRYGDTGIEIVLYWATLAGTRD